MGANCKLCRVSYQVVFVAQGSLVAYYLDFRLIGTSSILIHFQDWLIGSCLALYDKGNRQRVTAIGTLSTHRMSTYRRRWSDFSIAIERIFCVIRCMEGKSSTRGSNLHLSILGTVECLYTECWFRWCLLNHKGYGVATHRLTLAYYLYIVIESTSGSERRYIVRRICPYMGTAYIGSGSGLVPLVLERTTSFGYHAEWPNRLVLAIGISYRRCCDSGLLIDSYPYWNGTFLFTTIILDHTIVIGNSC